MERLDRMVDSLLTSVKSLESSVEGLHSMVESLNDRLRSLEGIAASISSFEARFNRIEHRLDELVDSIADTSKHVSLLNGQLRGGQSQSSRTAAYLSAIGALAAALLTLIALLIGRWI